MGQPMGQNSHRPHHRGDAVAAVMQTRQAVPEPIMMLLLPLLLPLVVVFSAAAAAAGFVHVEGEGHHAAVVAAAAAAARLRAARLGHHRHSRAEGADGSHEEERHEYTRV